MREKAFGSGDAAHQVEEGVMNVRAASRSEIRATGSGITTGYMSGFGNGFETEALPGALPAGRNSPQRCPYGLYAEQLSGTAFTAPRAHNRRSWLYRIRPAAMHAPFERVEAGRIVSRFDDVPATPNQLRWNPLPMPSV